MDGSKSRDASEQLPLFPGAASSSGASARSRVFGERLERERSEAAVIAAKLPENVRFGTSSWSCPGWAGIG
jgi:hypothetical protein